MRTGYVKPQGLKDDMGGYKGKPDTRMREIFTLLKYIPARSGKVLDVGVGKGQISELFLKMKDIESVEGIGLALDSYGLEKNGLNGRIKLTECSVEDMPFEDGTFDIVVASHILEHVPNMGLALSEIRRVVKMGGWIYIFLPKYTDIVCAGHINIGWNLGQLMYVLLLNGFDVKHGKFIEYGYSLCAYVRKADMKLPALRGDKGDISILNREGLFPLPIRKHNGWSDGFYGDIQSINWDHAEDLLSEKRKDCHASIQKKLANVIVGNLAKVFGQDRCIELGKLFMKAGNGRINPKEL